MNLDELQHNTSKLAGMSKDNPIDIFISGGNAAIDAVTRIVRKDFVMGLDTTVDTNFNFGEQPGPVPEHETLEDHQHRHEM